MKAQAQGRKKFKVTWGNASIWVVPYRDGWRFHWRETFTSPWQHTFRKLKADATEAADQYLRKLPGVIDWEALPPGRRAFLEAVHRASSENDQAAVLAFLAGRKKSGALSDAVKRFNAFKVASKGGKETDHLATVRRDLENLADAFSGEMVIDVPLDKLAAWLDARTGDAGDHRRKGIRTTLVMFWNWCQKDGIAGNERYHVAHRLPTIDPGAGKLEIFSLEELEFLLSIVEAKWFPLIILGAFEGIRPEELAPKETNDKPGLTWENIQWDFDSILVPKEVAKGVGSRKRKRLIPLHPVTRAWLEAYGVEKTWTGRICLENPTEVHPRATTIWGKALAERFPARFTEWPQDVLRHSYASYRNAVVRNLHQVAEEMGNSEDMLHQHYNNPRTDAQGEEWFNFYPQDAKSLASYLKVA